jgi:hypothetical protein
MAHEKEPQAMKKDPFRRVGVTERQAGFQLAWTLSLSLMMLILSISAVFRH